MAPGGSTGSFLGGTGAVLYPAMGHHNLVIHWSGSRKKADGHEFIEEPLTHVRARLNEMSRCGSISLS